VLALTVLQHGNGNFKLNFHRDLREIESFFEACLAAAATLTFLRSLVRHLARFAHTRRRFWPRGRCPVAVARTVQKLEDSSGKN
jgi:hypothetical protein